MAIRPSQVALVIKNPPPSAGDARDTGSIPGSGRYFGRGHGNPLQYSCLENPMDRKAQQTTLHGVTQHTHTQTHTHTHTHTHTLPLTFSLL